MVYPKAKCPHLHIVYVSAISYGWSVYLLFEMQNWFQAFEARLSATLEGVVRTALAPAAAPSVERLISNKDRCSQTRASKGTERPF